MLKLKGLVLAGALFVASAMPAAAQDGLGLGLSFLGDEGGAGFLVDYSQPFKTQNTGARLGWVGEFSYFPGDFFSTLMAQGGVRASGRAGEKLNWLAHGMVGMLRQSADGGDIVDDLCDVLDLDCDASNTGALLTIGGGVEYAINEKSGLRGQLDFPIALTDGGGNTTRFTIAYVLKMGGN